MKIINFEPKAICYKFKKRDVRIERFDMWGEPEKYPDSLLSYCQRYMTTSDKENVHTLYVYGQGGTGKSFICQEITSRLQDDPYQEQLYVVSVDLQQQKGFEEQLKRLADELIQQTKNPDLFPRFYMAYCHFKSKLNEEVKMQQCSTRWDNLQDNNAFSFLSATLEAITPIGTASQIIGYASEGYKLLKDIIDDKRWKNDQQQISSMDLKEVRSRLTEYFAADFCAYMKKQNTGLKHGKKKKKIVFLLDTVESMRYQVLRSGTGEDYLEWLTGRSGLFRLLPNCFWLLFGREEIQWKDYDPEWETSFRNIQCNAPSKEEVIGYLLQQFGDDRKELALTICEKTEQYMLAIENCVDIFFRIWNDKLRASGITDDAKTEEMKPREEEMEGILIDRAGQKIISSRFLQYYTLQEREVLYTLLCLGTWTDQIIEDLIWSDSVGNFLIYEELCGTSFIQTGTNGQKTINCFLLDTIMQECPQNQKRHLLCLILQQLKNDKTVGLSDTWQLLYHSATRIARFCPCTPYETQAIGDAFVRFADHLCFNTDFYELQNACDDILDIVGKKDGEKEDIDLYNAALIGSCFADIFTQEPTQQNTVNDKLKILRGRQCFGSFSTAVWNTLFSIVIHAPNASNLHTAYNLAVILTNAEENISDHSCLISFLYDKILLMQELQRYGHSEDLDFGLEDMEQNAKKIRELLSDDSTENRKRGIMLLAQYYFNCIAVFYLSNEEESQLMYEQSIENLEELLEEYTECCSGQDISQDLNLCRLEIWPTARQNVFIADYEWSAPVLRGIRILYDQYGDAITDQAEADEFLGYLQVNRQMKKEDCDLLRKVFTAYCRKFTRQGDLHAYKVVRGMCSDNYFPVYVDHPNPEEDWDIYTLSDILMNEIFYLSNLSTDNPENMLKLLLCWDQLRGSLGPCMSSGGIEEKLMELTPEWYRKWYPKKQLCNNQLLFYFLQQAAAACLQEQNEQEQNVQNLHRLFLLTETAFDGYHNSLAVRELDDMELLLSLFPMWNTEIRQTIWKAKSMKDTRLNAMPGWIPASLVTDKLDSLLRALNCYDWYKDTETDAQVFCLFFELFHKVGEPLHSIKEPILRKYRAATAKDNGDLLKQAILTESQNYGKDLEERIRNEIL